MSLDQQAAGVARATTAAPRPVTPLGILTALLDDVQQRAAALGVDPGLLDDLGRARELAGGLDPYVERLTTAESPALADLATATARADWSDGGHVVALEQEMLSGHVEGQLLKMLVHATGAREVLEVGMFTGYSALAMAEAVPDGGRVVACELDPAVAAFAQQHLDTTPAGACVDVRVGPALDTLAALADAGEVFDLVFVDADKAGYAAYVDLVLERGLLAPDGLLCIDNTLLQGLPWLGADDGPGRAIADFNTWLAADPRVEQVVVPLRDGVTLARRVDRAGRAGT